MIFYNFYSIDALLKQVDITILIVHIINQNRNNLMKEKLFLCFVVTHFPSTLKIEKIFPHRRNIKIQKHILQFI